MTDTMHTRVAVIAEQRKVQITQIAYPLDQLSTITGVSLDALRRLIHNNTLPARHTGRRYLVTGPAAVGAGLRGVWDLLDYRDIIDKDVAYTLNEVGVFLGLSYYAARRLVLSRGLAAAGVPGARVHVRGAAILDYLGGCDEPMQHPESA